MTAERLTMRKVKEVLRLKFDVKLSNRQIAQSCSMCPQYGWRIHAPLPPVLTELAVARGHRR